MDRIWRFALEQLQAGSPTALVFVAHSEGSVPGKAGAKMIVSPSGCVGTVGGGELEHSLSQRGTLESEAFIRQVEHNGDSEGSICSGSQTIITLPLTQADAVPLAEVVEALRTKDFGTLSIRCEGLTFRKGVSVGRSFRGDAHWKYEETIGYTDSLTVVGGGHVSLALSPIAKSLGFKTRILDNRSGVRTMQENVHAHERIIVSYDEVEKQTPTGPSSYVLIMTHAHENDETVLERLIGNDYAYLGLMGSKRKIGLLFDRLKARGALQKDLDLVHAPVGLPIRSKTPSEIAVSIAAELIKVRNRK